jgi:hypothetical protein
MNKFTNKKKTYHVMVLHKTFIMYIKQNKQYLDSKLKYYIGNDVKK